MNPAADLHGAVRDVLDAAAACADACTELPAADPQCIGYARAWAAEALRAIARVLTLLGEP